MCIAITQYSKLECEEQEKRYYQKILITYMYITITYCITSELNEKLKIKTEKQ